MKAKEGTKNIDSYTQFRIDSLSTELEALKAENTALQIKLDSAEKGLDQEKETLREEDSRSKSFIQEKAMNRADILLNAAAYLKDIKSYIRRSNREIMVEAMNVNRTDAVDFSDLSDDYIEGAFNQFVSTNVNIDYKTDSKSLNNNAFDKPERCDSTQAMTTHDQLMELLKEDRNNRLK